MKSDTYVCSAVNPGSSCAEQLLVLVQKFELLGQRPVPKCLVVPEQTLAGFLWALAVLMTDWSSVFQNFYKSG